MSISNKIQKISDIILNKHNFALVYISFLLLRSVFFLQVYVDAVCKLCLLWGILIALCDLFKYKLKFFKVADSFLPLLLCVSYVVSIVLNLEYSLYGGIKNLMYLGIYFFVLLSIRKEENKENFFKFLKRNNDVFIAINMLIGIASIVTFLFSVRTIYSVGTDAYKVGFWFNRLNGVCNSNMETVMGLISVALCLLNIYLCKGKLGKIKALYIANFVVQFIYYALSGSRAATVCYAVLAAVVIAFWGYPTFKNKFGNLKALALVALSVVILLVGEFGVTKATQFTMKYAAYGVNLIMGGENTEDNSIDFERVEDFENGDITNNRAAMWTSAFKIVKQFPAFGVAYAQQMDIDGNINPKIDASVFNEADLSALKAAGFYFHNGFVQMILCGGIVFFVIFVLFTAKKAWKFIKYLFSRINRKSKNYAVVVILFALIAALIVDNVVEVHIMFSGQDSVAAFLWYLLGCGLFIIDSEKETEVNADAQKV